MLKNYQSNFEEVVNQLKLELNNLRTARATPALVENILIDAYGSSKMSLKELASISIPDARTILIKPWDKNIIKDIEKGLINSHLEFNPIVETETLRIHLPELTQETREKLVKNLKNILENAKIKIRRLRDEAKKEIENKQKAGELSEDEKFRLIDELNESTRDFSIQIEEIGKKKEEEIMTI